MESSRQVLTFLLTIAMTVAPLQGAMAGHDEMSDSHADHAVQTGLRDTHTDEPPAAGGAHAHCSHQPDQNTRSGSHEPLFPSGTEGGLQTSGLMTLCECSDNCSCCNKVLAPAIPSLYTIIHVPIQMEHEKISPLFTGIFVLVKTRPPTA